MTSIVKKDPGEDKVEMFNWAAYREHSEDAEVTSGMDDTIDSAMLKKLLEEIWFL